MGLQRYNQKRDFAKTPEPKGKARKAKGGDGYLVQKHAARRLHYDLRLEMDGVLKSWAVAKGPSLLPGEKRLAVHTEDHPLDYGDFEGTIPKGEYGGGTVVLWDRGRWEPIGDARKGYAKGHLEFRIHGEKLGGRWHLVRMAHKPREKKENWLLVKGDDEFARTEADPDILEERSESVKTGRTVEEIAGEAPGWSSKTGRIDKAEVATEPPKQAVAIEPPKQAKKFKWPGFIDPALATLKPAAPTGAKWIHEIKFDGYRVQAHVRQGETTLWTRGGLDWTAKFGNEVAGALAALPVSDAILDGELIAEGPSGASDFSALQADLSAGRTDRMIYCAFDLLHLDGRDLRPVPQVDRKAVLEKLLADAPAVLRYSDHFEEDGELVLRHACRLSLEGVVSKDRDAPYRSGRGREWIKSKCAERQEFVVAGYVPSTTSRKAIGSLALGYYEDGRLIPAGKVGTGYTHKVAEDIFRRLQKLRQDDSPYAQKLAAAEARQLVFVRPELVAEVEFRAWTADGMVRHASFRGLREDRNPRDVRRESAGAAPPEKARPEVRLTHPDRLYWPEAGVTKQGLADYYVEVWARMGPFVVNRALALVRCPNGIEGDCFFQKHVWRGISGDVLRAHDPKDKSDEPIIGIDGLPGLLGLVQGGVLEIHPWGSQLDDLDRPDFINMDLDPGPGVGMAEIIKAALEVRERLREAGLESFVKTSGGKGLHVVAPLKPRAGWDEVKAFAKSLADAMAADSPDRYVATVTKSKRHGRTLIDYLRNARGSTAIAPYSTRARPGAAVSMPLDWGELSPGLASDHFTVGNASNRLGALDADPWADFWKAARPLGGRRRKAA